MDPADLRACLASGLLSFPVTHFDADLAFVPRSYARHVEAMARFPAAALFASGGTGEFFSLTPDEVVAVTRAAAEASRLPIVMGCGYGTAMACDLARRAEGAGAAGILLLPHYLIEAGQAGLMAHVRAVCQATGLGVIVYNRGLCRLSADSVETLAEACPNLIGFKDGTGQVDLVREVALRLGDRLTYIGGMPTHELFAEAYFGAGVTTYSSAVFNFVPDLAVRFFEALRSGDRAATDAILKSFFVPWARIRDAGPGYAVAAVKAGARLKGYGGGPVRPPLTDIEAAVEARLRALIEAHEGLEAAA